MTFTAKSRVSCLATIWLLRHEEAVSSTHSVAVAAVGSPWPVLRPFSRCLHHQGRHIYQVWRWTVAAVVKASSSAMASLQPLCEASTTTKFPKLLTNHSTPCYPFFLVTTAVVLILSLTTSRKMWCKFWKFVTVLKKSRDYAPLRNN